MKPRGEVTTESSARNSTPLKIFFGTGSGPDGESSGFGWLCPETDQKQVERVAQLTNNQAEYNAFLAAVQSLPDGTTVEMFSDSELVVSQFSGLYRVEDYDLQQLLAKILTLIFTKNLKLTLEWVPRTLNLAGKLFEGVAAK